MEISRNIRVDSVSRLDPLPPIEILPSATIREAVQTLQQVQGNGGCLLVTDGGRLLGIFTERDLLTRVLAVGRSFDTTLQECMTPNPVTVSAKDPVRTAMNRMQKGGYRHLPVLDESGKPVGVLSAQRVVHYLVEHFPALVFNQPPVLGRYPDKPEGA